jgi:SAM-dependent MidA family methyltransferase
MIVRGFGAPEVPIPLTITEVGAVDRWTTWREATERALYGEHGFFRRSESPPSQHFRTSVHASPVFAEAVRCLARDAGLTTVVDVGAGGGELLAALHALDPSLDLVGVDLADRPAGLPADVAWQHEVHATTGALLVANEWLDDVPVDVVELADDGWRLVLVDPATGAERLGPAPADDDADWLATWWPAEEAGEVGARAEIGRPRDEAWAGAVSRVTDGLAVAIDYAHDRSSRPPAGSLTGYRDGRQVPPVPDGSCDVTSHVALDACAAAGIGAGATATLLTSQRVALTALGVRRAAPPHEQSRTDPAGYLRALSRAGEVAELTDPGGLGGFGWLLQARGLRRVPLDAAPSPTPPASDAAGG